LEAATTGGERDPNSAAATLQNKLRSYATVGQEAKPLSAGPGDAIAPALRPSTDAVQSVEPPVGQAPKSDAGAAAQPSDQMK
jgi:hypothetical protein